MTTSTTTPSTSRRKAGDRRRGKWGFKVKLSHGRTTNDGTQGVRRHLGVFRYPSPSLPTHIVVRTYPHHSPIVVIVLPPDPLALCAVMVSKSKSNGRVAGQILCPCRCRDYRRARDNVKHPAYTTSSSPALRRRRRRPPRRLSADPRTTTVSTYPFSSLPGRQLADCFVRTCVCVNACVLKCAINKLRNVLHWASFILLFFFPPLVRLTPIRFTGRIVRLLQFLLVCDVAAAVYTIPQSVPERRKPSVRSKLSVWKIDVY